MNKKFKKICSMVLTLAITAASAINMSVSADSTSVPIDSFFTYINPPSFFSGFTIVDDKDIMQIYDDAEYKILCDQYGTLYRADPILSYAKFILSEDVNYEDVNERVNEIFKEFYPDDYLYISSEGMSRTELIDYVSSYSQPIIRSETVDGVTTYTVSIASRRPISNLNDKRLTTAKKYSKAFMKKLNEEKLISAFYDFGEVYEFAQCSGSWVSYPLEVNIELVNNYIDQHNINCTIKKGDDYYQLEFKEGTKMAEKLLTAVGIYETTSIKPIFGHSVLYLAYDVDLYGKNSLEEISDVTNSKEVKITGDANGDGELNIRDAAFIAIACAKGQYEYIPEWADYNEDGQRNIRDAAAIAIYLASR